MFLRESYILFYKSCILSFVQTQFSYKERFDKHQIINEPRYDISNNVVCATSKSSDQPGHMRSLIRAFASRLNIL